MKWSWALVVAAGLLVACETERSVPARDAGPDMTPVRRIEAPGPAADGATPDASSPDGAQPEDAAVDGGAA
ncbi:MAG: hypothetical protein KC613_22085 [Myxococcales bacterium]|nr:hypothetical protein [Myxococcales bacterium]MCB9522048.1 hypothetical protein [Myxococcales bacterium]